MIKAFKILRINRSVKPDSKPFASKTYSLSVLATLLLVLTGCSGVSPAVQQPSVDVLVSSSDSSRLSYNGPGAGAGMMLMGSMGPMGIAIGVAIDEGFRKEIETQLLAEGFNPEVMVQEVVSDRLDQLCLGPIDLTYQLCGDQVDQLSVYIYNYGFKTLGGENDPTEAFWDIGLSIDQGEEVRLDSRTSPESSIERTSQEAPQTEPLDRLKLEGSASQALLKSSLSKLLADWGAE